MNTTRIGAAVLAAATAAVIVIVGPASADTIASETPPVILAQDTTPAPATIPADVVGIDANIVGGLTVTGHKGKTVTATAKGRPTKTATVPASRPAVLKGLAPGAHYAVSIGGRKVAIAVPLAQVGAASALRVETTGSPDTVQLTWVHTPAAHEGSAVIFDVTAAVLNPDGTERPNPRTIRATVSTSAMEGLDTHAIYRFTITPRNTASSGRPSSATMTRTLADLTPSPPKAPAPAPAPAPTTAPAPTPASAPAAAQAPAAPAAPATRTIYVCPDGYTDAGSTCTKTAAYTFHSETVTAAYTYHSEPTYGYGQVGWTYSWGYCAGSGNSGTWPNGDPYCQTAVYGDNVIVGYQNLKDAAPAGYTDDGTQYTKTTQVKDAPPAGYTDSGTAWVTTTGKVARIVPA